VYSRFVEKQFQNIIVEKNLSLMTTKIKIEFKSILEMVKIFQESNLVG